MAADWSAVLSSGPNRCEMIEQLSRVKEFTYSVAVLRGERALIPAAQRCCPQGKTDDPVSARCRRLLGGARAVEAGRSA